MKKQISLCLTNLLERFFCTRLGTKKIAVWAFNITNVIAITSFAWGLQFGRHNQKKEKKFLNKNIDLTANGSGLLISLQYLNGYTGGKRHRDDSNNGFFIGGAAGFTIADLISEKKGVGASILLELDYILFQNH